MAYAPGKHFRDGLSVQGAVPRRQGSGEMVHRGTLAGGCPHCGPPTSTPRRITSRCPTAARNGSAAKRQDGKPMHSSKLGWTGSTPYCVATNLKSVSSMKMHRDLDITQKSAWFRRPCPPRVEHQPEETFEGPVEATWPSGWRIPERPIEPVSHDLRRSTERHVPGTTNGETLPLGVRQGSGPR